MIGDLSAELRLLPLVGVAAYVALQHLWLWLGRRSEPLHLWVVAWCANTVLYLVSRYIQHSTDVAGQAMLGARLSWMSALLLAVLSVGLTHAIVQQPLARRLVATLLAATGAGMLLLWFGDAFVTHEAYVRTDLLGHRYLAPVPGRVLPLVAFYVLIVFVYCFRLVWRTSALDGSERRVLLWGFVGYGGFGLNDILHSARLIQSVPVFDVAFVAVAVGLTYVLARRHNRLHTHLSEEVAAQTRILHGQKDELATLVRALQESEERYRLLFERNLAGVLWTRRDGTVVDCNESFARLMGYESRESVLPHHVADFYMDLNDRKAVLSGLEPGGMTSGRELCWRRRDGTPVWLRVNLRATDAGLLEGILVDISDEKRLAETEREAAALRAVAAVAGAAAHEINNPLTVLLGQVTLLGRENPGSARIARIVEAAGRIRDIVGRMARITRVEMFEHTSANLPPMLDLRKSTDEEPGDR